MIYRQFKEATLSALGFGGMRLPVLDNDNNRPDPEAVQEMVDLAMARGINYYDTAWGYHGGHSEAVLGQALSKYPRSGYYLADKFPGYDLDNMDKAEEIFKEQLRRCGTDYFDFYLFHNVCEQNIDAYLDTSHGVMGYLLQQKQAGRIRHLGLSVHGSLEVLERFLEAYGEELEFCQIQLNYIDYDFQQARAKVDLLNRLGLSVIVMEPLRGGRLAALDEQQTALLRRLRPRETTPGWAFRFIQSIPGVAVTLSGMSNMQQLKQNLDTYATEEPLQEREIAALLELAAQMVRQTTLPCTACRYCLEHCPQGLDIPTLLAVYNEHSFTGGGFLAPTRISTIEEGKRPGDCLACHSCEAVCPQQLPIAQALADFTEKLKQA